MTTSSTPDIPASAFDLRARMQLLHPEKTLALWELPHEPETDSALLARIFDADAAIYDGVRAGFRDGARAAASALLRDPRVRAAVDALAFARGEVVVALGDSITDDYQSWAAILGELLALRRLADVRLVNRGVSGDTTADVLRRLWHVAPDLPTWVVVLVGTNDARRDNVVGEMLVSHEETARNLTLIRRWAVATGVRHLVWMTPPPVLEESIARSERTAARGLSWRNTDLAEKARLVRRQPDAIVDVSAKFQTGPLDKLILPDGLHPSLAGQTLILTSLLETLARTFSADGTLR
jgi:lysophospholipase L1-like esterase